MNKTELVANVAEKAGLTKKDAEKYLQQAFPVLWLEDQMVYDKKKEYLKKKFGI